MAKDQAPDDNMAVDGDGQPLSYSPTEVPALVLKMIDEGDILAAIVRGPTGDLAVQVFGPLSRELLGALEQTVKAYRRVLKGHRLIDFRRLGSLPNPWLSAQLAVHSLSCGATSGALRDAGHTAH